MCSLLMLHAPAVWISWSSPAEIGVVLVCHSRSVLSIGRTTQAGASRLGISNFQIKKRDAGKK
jgi:hypothetical protein